jgi:hypothetical protein
VLWLCLCACGDLLECLGFAELLVQLFVLPFEFLHFSRKFIGVFHFIATSSFRLHCGGIHVGASCFCGCTNKHRFQNIEFIRKPVFCKVGLPLNSILQVCAGLSSVLYSWLVSPPHTEGVAVEGGPKNLFSQTLTLLVNHFCNFGLPLSSEVQFPVTSQLSVVLLVCVCPPPPPPPPPHTLLHERVSQQVPSQKYGSYMEFTRQPFLQFRFAPKPGFTVLCCPSALCCTHWLSLHDAVQSWVAQQAHFQKHGFLSCTNFEMLVCP